MKRNKKLSLSSEVRGPKMTEQIHLAANAEDALFITLVNLMAAAAGTELSLVDVADALMGKSWDEVAYQALKWIEQIQTCTA